MKQWWRVFRNRKHTSQLILLGFVLDRFKNFCSFCFSVCFASADGRSKGGGPCGHCCVAVDGPICDVQRGTALLSPGVDGAAVEEGGPIWDLWMVGTALWCAAGRWLREKVSPVKVGLLLVLRSAVKGGSLRLKVEDQRKGGCAAPFVLWFWPGDVRVRGELSGC